MEKYEEWLSNFGNRVRVERERQNLTRAMLADMAKTEQGYIVQIERGSRSPSLKTFANLLNALGVSADYLMFGITDEDKNEKESTLIEFSNLLRRGDIEDIDILYKLAAHMMRSKPTHELSKEISIFESGNK